MDRLSPVGHLALAALVFVSAGCGHEPAQPAMSRVEAVAATGEQPDPARWCDALYTGPDAPELVLPEVVPARPGGTIPRLPTDRWVWVNVWATWCGPCRREMPLLETWAEHLRKEGRDVDLWFVSVDDSDADLARFLTEHPDLARGTSVRLASSKELDGWLKRFQKEPSTAIPIQILAAPGGKVRCVRAGSLRDGDLPLVEAMMR
jgi:thiol-disulfide isomerase/thioredoxin